MIESSLAFKSHISRIENWKLEQKENKTKKNRPDLWLKYKNDLE